MPLPDLSRIEDNATAIVDRIGHEAVSVYCFLADELARTPRITDSPVFQFVYRSFYRLDSAGLSPEFKTRYFELLQLARSTPAVDLRALTNELMGCPNLKGQRSMQFSFVTKLTNTVNPRYPIYDSEVASVFGFRVPAHTKPPAERLNRFMAFHDWLEAAYSAILNEDRLMAVRVRFGDVYAAHAARVPDVKVLDFIFWAAGKLKYQASPNWQGQYAINRKRQAKGHPQREP
jgi:hypothetical protein